jgi:hypothetical protein
MKAYAVQARTRTKLAELSQYVDLPTFYLLADVQGIVDLEHAKQIALGVLVECEVWALSVYEVML